MTFDMVRPAVISGTWRYRHDRDYEDIRQEGYLRAAELLHAQEKEGAALYMAVLWGAINAAEKWRGRRAWEVPMGEKVFDIPTKTVDSDLVALHVIKQSRPILYAVAASRVIDLAEGRGVSRPTAGKARARARRCLSLLLRKEQ